MSGAAAAAKGMMGDPAGHIQGASPPSGLAAPAGPARQPSSAQAYTIPAVRAVSGTLATGRHRGSYDQRKFKFLAGGDVVGPVVSGFRVSKADRMTADEAGDRMQALMAEHVQGAPASQQMAFVHALLFCHTLNGASVLSPGRAGFSIVSGSQSWRVEYIDVVKSLGPDLRRFFRAYADETRSVNKAVMDARDAGDWESVERAAMLEQVAMERGLGRYPDLAHDSADACTGLTAPERTAVIASTRRVVESSANNADKI